MGSAAHHFVQEEVGHARGSLGVPGCFMYELLRASLPEFFGSLGAALVLTASAWGAARLRSRRNRAEPAETDEQA